MTLPTRRRITGGTATGQGTFLRFVEGARGYAMAMDMTDLGKWFRSRRQASGRTMKEIAADVGYSYQWLDNVEAARREPSLQDLARLAAVLGGRLHVEVAPADAGAPVWVPEPIARTATELASLPADRHAVVMRMIRAVATGVRLDAVEAAATLLESAGREAPPLTVAPPPSDVQQELSKASGDRRHRS